MSMYSSTMKSSKQKAPPPSSSSSSSSVTKRIFSDHTLTLHQRLYQALNLGIKNNGDNNNKHGKKWQSKDIEIQRLAVRSISAFLACISSDLLRQPLVKDSIADILLALEGVLQSRNEAVLGMATNVTMKLVDILGSSTLQYHVSEIVHSLLLLLSFHQSSIAVSCAITLNKILLKLKPGRFKKHNEILEILVEKQAIDCVISGLYDFVFGSKPLEYFQELASLLKTILWHWTPARYPVWTNAKLVEALGVVFSKADSSIDVAVLQLCSALALCGTVTTKLLGCEESFLQMVVRCMGSSQPYSVRVEAFKLAQCLVRSEHGCLTMMKLFSEPIVKATIDAMDGLGFYVKFSADQVLLLVEAYRFALVTRWEGVHHMYFWKFRIYRVLLDLLHKNYSKSKQSQDLLSLQELIAVARDGLDSNYNMALRPYAWDILGWLATHSAENFSPDTGGDLNCFNVLVAYACLVFMDSIDKGRQVSHNDVSYTSMYEPAARAVLLMIYSPCKYIASQARDILSEELLNAEYQEYSLDIINYTSVGSFYVLDNLKAVMNLIQLACYLGLPNYQNFIIKSECVKILSAFIEWCLSNKVKIRRSRLVHHLYNAADERTCCWLERDDWEGCNILFFSLWALAELIKPSRPVRNHEELTSDPVVGDIELEGPDARVLVDKLQEIRGNNFDPGTRWYASYILSFFGLYGFQSRLGKRIGNAFYEKEFTDVLLKLSTGESLRVHGVVLIVRCPSMFPVKELSLNEQLNGESNTGQVEKLCKSYSREVRLSPRVDHQTLMKLLEFVYTGFVEVSDNLVKKLKILAKHCDIYCLSCMLHRKRPKWGSVIPCYDFTPALGSIGNYFSDIILEAKATREMQFTCSVCSLLMPHLHVHKIILWLSCDYLRAMFQSGMQESHSQIIKVPVSWEALIKLIDWFYLDELPKPSSGCLWDNMDVKQKLHELHPYVELCWLAEFWFLDEIRLETLKVVVSSLNSSTNLCIKVMEIAADLSQWEIVNAAANCIAPSYPHLRNSSDLDSLNEELVDMLRMAYVRFTQEGGFDHSDDGDKRGTS